jgi:EmrB/QacA subfamily drug resistance transporter
MENRRTVLFVSTAAAFLTPFMGSSLNIALPTIGREFSMTAVALGWVATSYLLAAAIGLVPFGRIADMTGRAAIFTWGSLVYASASALSTVAGSAAFLLITRALQGLGGAMVMSTGVAILTSAYPPGDRGRVLGINVSSTYLGLSLGPVLGGFLTQNLGWRSIFWLNAICGLTVFVLAVTKLRDENHEPQKERFDIPGAILLGLALTGIMLGLSRLPKPAGVGLLAGGLVCLAGFIRVERSSPAPLLDIALFSSNAVFAFSNLAALINYSATAAVGFLLSLYLQEVKGLSPQKAGLVLIAQPVMMALFSPLAGRLSDRIEPRYLASAGMGLSVLGLGLLAVVGSPTAVPLVSAVLVVLGLGFALFSSPNTNAVMSSVGRNRYGIASATLGTMRFTGQMLSMGAAMLIFALFLGRARITPETAPRFVSAQRTAFIFFAALCLAGVFASLKRGHLRNGEAAK